VASDQEVAKLKDMAQPFTRMAEMREAAAKRLAIQEQDGKREQAALMPQSLAAAQGPGTQQQPAEQARNQGSAVKDEAGRRRNPVDPAPEKKWVTTPLRHGRTLYAHPEALQSKFRIDRSKYAALEEIDAEIGEQESKLEEHPPQLGTIEVLPNTDQENKAPIPLTTEARELLHLVQAKPPKLRAPPVLSVPVVSGRSSWA
jgi:hypothetical protein